MLIFLLISIAAGLALWSLLTETVLAGIAALGVALASLCIIAAVAWTDRRKHGKARTEDATANENTEDSKDHGTYDQDHSEEASVGGAPESPDDTGSPQNLQEPEDAGTRAPLQVAPPRNYKATGNVWIIPDRKRFHHRECSSLTGHDTDELTTEEALEEGFTPCSLCRPDDKTIRRAG